MTLDEFFEKLPRDGWRLVRGVEIERTDEKDCCPWIWMNDRGYEYEPASAIWYAADKRLDYDPALRARLLAHCGLKEGKAGE